MVRPFFFGDAMEANVAVDMETIHVHQSVDICFEVTRQYVRRSAALVSALADAGQMDRCNAPKRLRDLGQQLAEAQAQEAYLAGLGHEWSNVADSSWKQCLTLPGILPERRCV